MIRRVLLGLLAVAAALAVFVASRPSAFRVERSARIDAPADVIFRHVDDFHLWEGWSPYEKLDPAMKREYAGPTAGIGATYQWTGNGRAGAGRMTIVESEPNRRLGIELAFTKPFEATNRVTFAFTPDGPATNVTWTMDGNYIFLTKAMSLILDMDKMVGADFEQGLADLGRVCRAERAPAD